MRHCGVIFWFERRFDFSFPLELFPNLCARLRGTPARLSDLLSDRPRGQLIAKADGKWSAQEQAGHILDLESLWLTRVDDYLAGHASLTPADLKNRKTFEARHNDRPLLDTLAEFRSARQSLLKRIEGLDSSALSRSLPHPRLQTPMRLLDHLFFVAEHDDHHLVTIWELLQK
jgi:uncharacterized damage-inducible protein DinB